jgi:hypothetical protein
MDKRYTMPRVLSADTAANLALFLLENTGSIAGVWHGKMAVADQRALACKAFAGKQTVHLNGAKQTIACTRKVCFGTDYEETMNITWAQFERR